MEFLGVTVVVSAQKAVSSVDCIALSCPREAEPGSELCRVHQALPVFSPTPEVPKREEEVEPVADQGTWSRKKLTVDEAVAGIRREVAALGYTPSQRTWKTRRLRPSADSILRLFSSWEKACEAANVAPPPVPNNATPKSSVREPEALSVAESSSEAADAVESSGALLADDAGSRTDEQSPVRLVPAPSIELHAEWYANLPPEISELTDEIARLDELAAASARQRDALQAFLDVLEAA